MPVAILALAAMALWQLTGPAFVAAPARSQVPELTGAAALAGLMAYAPVPAEAAELTGDGFGPGEITVCLIPIVFTLFGLYNDLKDRPPIPEDAEYDPYPMDPDYIDRNFGRGKYKYWK